MKLVIKNGSSKKETLNLESILRATMNAGTLYIDFGLTQHSYYGEEAKFFWRRICDNANGRKPIELR